MENQRRVLALSVNRLERLFPRDAFIMRHFRFVDAASQEATTYDSVINY